MSRGVPCRARTRAGGKCQSLVIGGGPCRKHGGNLPQHKRRNQMRRTFEDELARDPRRTADEVLADVLHQSDHLMRKARQEVNSDVTTAETMAKLIEAAERAGQWAQTALKSEVEKRQTRVMEAEAAVLAAVVTRILGRLNLTAEQRALVPVVVPEEMRAATAIEG